MPSSESRASVLSGVTIGPYVERRNTRLSGFDQALLGASESVRVALSGTRGRNRAAVRRIEALGPRMRAMSDRELRAYAEALRPRLLRQGLRAAPVDEAFALIRETTERKIGLRHYPVQLLGGLVLIAGRLAEMRTGEGKTIVALLPAITAGLSGVPVHVVTVNDYLARRDADALRPVYEALGLSVGLVQAGQSAETRKAAYACDVTYCTNKELVFDYLRDRITYRRLANGTGDHDQSDARGPLADRFLLRGLHFAIVDEADSVLIDEARTPLIISAEKSSTSEALRYETALEIARQLKAGLHYRISDEGHHIVLTARGREVIGAQSHRLPGVWRSTRAREELIQQALTALVLFHRDKQYIVSDGKVRIVDEYTGRIMADRSWERGLHQLMEVKEGCDPSQQRESLAQITYQRFFRRYMRLSGMTGTAREVAGELCAVYGLRTYQIPTNRPEQRHYLGAKIYRTAREKWVAVVAAATAQTALGRPVLIGTRSIAASETLSALLNESGTDHVVLNARQDQIEAEIVAAAGQRQRITVATNMAGRGTDIVLADGVAEKGGLHVILTEYHESARIDRQLVGRAGRQGDPGSYQIICSLEDEIFQRYAPLLTRWAARYAPLRIPGLLARLLRHRAQGVAERYHSRARRQIVRRDQELDRAFAFAGQPD